MTARRTTLLWVAAELHIKCGTQARNGIWTEEPTARYVCHRCNSTEGPVYGVRPVQSFVEHVKAIHAGRCSGQTAAVAG